MKDYTADKASEDHGDVDRWLVELIAIQHFFGHDCDQENLAAKQEHDTSQSFSPDLNAQFLA